MSLRAIRFAATSFVLLCAPRGLAAAPSTPAESPADPANGAASPEERGDEEEYSAVATVAAPAREPTKRSVSGEELREMPGTRGDAVRAIEVLPGVGRTSLSNGDPIIRGARCASPPERFPRQGEHHESIRSPV